MSFLHSEMTRDDVIKWDHFPYYRPFVRGIHQSLVDSLHKSQQCGTFIHLFIFFMSAQTNCSTNIHLTSDLRWWCSCDIFIMNSWNSTPQWKKGEMLRFRPLLYLLKWTRALPETEMYLWNSLPSQTRDKFSLPSGWQSRALPQNQSERPPSMKIRTHDPIVNTCNMSADDLLPKGAKASAATVLAQFSKNTLPLLHTD